MTFIYAGNRLFDFRDEDVDFYLPQLVNLYLNIREVAEVIHPYIKHRYATVNSHRECVLFRCREHVDFALQTAWLLDAFGVELNNSRHRSHGAKLRHAIVNDELRWVTIFDCK